MQFAFTSWDSLKCYSRKTYLPSPSTHENKRWTNSKTILMTFMRWRSGMRSSNAGINFIQNHPPPRDKPPGHDSKGAKTLPPGQ